MNKEFVPYQESLELKELGFDEPCLFAYYGKSDISNFKESDHVLCGDRHNTSFQKDGRVSAPLYQQVFRWFRERCGYDIHVRGTNFRASYVIGLPKEINMKSGDGYPLVIDWDYIVDETGERKNYEEAELACLRKLIEIVKEKENG